ncbi:hypothetical protein ATO49_27900 [Mycolicibacterium fortuitum subsp. fortuitum DSM 46621 = ATCC 6841 = JCM 6387]|nr:hypothetical protein G155_29205 [Mycobacterium sp. VKM Ac-1817D]AMD56166.1 hypothetical protein ATO49_27900 [Mycolicibacterium fortuitum subsp. fortuitum DSM 46621 = ATCC 6841 = JCM 6387]
MLMLLTAGCVIDGQPVRNELPTAADLGLPEQSRLAMPMQRQPVRGWRIGAATLGLDPKAAIRYSPIRNVGDRAIFLAMAVRDWWVIGIDVANGHRLFESVPLGQHESAEDMLASACFANGPKMVVCLRGSAEPAAPTHAWVIDTDTGGLLYDGPTDLNWSTPKQDPAVQQLGDYLVATVDGQGVYGVGPHAELTWHVPGTGFVEFPTDDASDVPAPVLAVASRLREPDVVFSLADGKVLTPKVSAGEEVRRAVVYPDGFAYQRERNYKDTGITFFDNAGSEKGQFDGAAELLSGSEIVPVARTADADRVLTMAGKPMLELSKPGLMPYTRLAGTTLLVSTDEDRRMWRQFDLRTGEEAKTCDNEALWYSYIGSSGDVVVMGGGRTLALAQAMDLATCEILWTLPGSTDNEAKDLWRVNTTLVLRVNNELSSLVPPD